MLLDLEWPEEDYVYERTLWVEGRSVNHLL